jgi:glycosyltransferase involved in cell wall biosynthesis
MNMHLVIVADTFVPLRTSGAIQLFDLSRALVRQGHRVVVLVPDASEDRPWWRVERLEGVEVYRFKSPKIKDTGHLRRTLAEWLTPYFVQMLLRFTPLWTVRWDGVIWYSPSIFLTPLAKKLSAHSKCRNYLIVRDIFPEWALDMGLMGPGWIYKIFRWFADRQYKTADVIGIQTQGNRTYFTSKARQLHAHKLEVLHNWLEHREPVPCRIDLSTSKLAGRILLVYAGNMGVAQGVSILLDLAQAMQSDPHLGFVFVGRGSDYAHMQADADQRGLDNVCFHSEIDPSEIPGLYAQCHIGLVALDPRHQSHNIPGKFLSYMHAGLPVLACVNPGNDLLALIESEGVGQAVAGHDLQALVSSVQRLIHSTEIDKQQRRLRCLALAQKMFNADTAAAQIVQGLQEKKQPQAEASA